MRPHSGPRKAVRWIVEDLVESGECEWSRLVLEGAYIPAAAQEIRVPLVPARTPDALLRERAFPLVLDEHRQVQAAGAIGLGREEEGRVIVLRGIVVPGLVTWDCQLDAPV